MVIKVYGMESPVFGLQNVRTIVEKIGRENEFPSALMDLIKIVVIFSIIKTATDSSDQKPLVEIISGTGTYHKALLLAEEFRKLGFLAVHLPACSLKY